MAGCLVCGNPNTVKAHVFPRALIHDQRADDKHVMGASADRAGWQYSQSGPWNDRILCDEHEGHFKAIDDYAVRFCRAFVAKCGSAHVGSVEVANPKPERLVLFAYSEVWRSLAAKDDGRGLSALGPFRAQIEAALFDGAATRLPLVLTSMALEMGDGNRAKIALGAYSKRLADRRLWHFRISHIDFMLFVDGQALPPVFEPWKANDANPARIALSSIGVEQARILAPTLAKASETY